jgi:hypothetical protein
MRLPVISNSPRLVAHLPEQAATLAVSRRNHVQYRDDVAGGPARAFR